MFKESEKAFEELQQSSKDFWESFEELKKVLEKTAEANREFDEKLKEIFGNECLKCDQRVEPIYYVSERGMCIGCVNKENE